MTPISANFFSRTELQRLIFRVYELLKQTKDVEQQAILLSLLTGAANLEGLLAEIPITTHPNGRALANPHGWKYEWVGGHWTIDNISVNYAQQILKPNGRQRISTGRYRLILGDEMIISTDRMKLRGALCTYLREQNATPDTEELLLFRMFADVEVQGEDNAIFVEESKTLDVGQPTGNGTTLVCPHPEEQTAS